VSPGRAPAALALAGEHRPHARVARPLAALALAGEHRPRARPGDPWPPLAALALVALALAG